jgi:hypothetical protein
MNSIMLASMTFAFTTIFQIPFKIQNLHLFNHYNKKIKMIIKIKYKK